MLNEALNAVTAHVFGEQFELSINIYACTYDYICKQIHSFSSISMNKGQINVYDHVWSLNTDFFIENVSCYTVKWKNLSHVTRSQKIEESVTCGKEPKNKGICTNEMQN